MADVDVRLSERADSAATCVFCHEALGPRAIACTGCGVGLHAACRDEASRCPTLGCGQTWEHRPDAALANRTHVTPIAGFRPIVRGAAGRGELGLDLTGPSRKLKMLILVLLPLVVGALLMIKSVERGGDGRVTVIDRAARDADEMRAADAPQDPELDTRAERDEAIRTATAAVAAAPLVVSGDEESTWRAGSLESFLRANPASHSRDPGVLLLGFLSATGSPNGLSLVDARLLMAGLRQRALAALPPAAAESWAHHDVGSSADVRFVFDRLERGVRDLRPFEDSSRAALEVDYELVAVRDDAIDLRVTVKHAYAPVSWLETWPRAVDAALRLVVLEELEDPTSVVVLNRISRQVRTVSALADGVRVQVFQEDGLPLPWHATVQRDVDGQRSYRVELELLEWRPAP